MIGPKTLAQERASEEARKWSLASSACQVSSLALIACGDTISRFLAPRLGVEADTLRLGFALLPMVWIGVMIFCTSRAHERRRVALGDKDWRVQKREFQEELARAEEYLGIKR